MSDRPCVAVWDGGRCDREARAGRLNGLCEGHRRRAERERPMGPLRSRRPPGPKPVRFTPEQAVTLADVAAHPGPYDAAAAAARLGLGSAPAVRRRLLVLVKAGHLIPGPRRVRYVTDGGHPVRGHTPYALSSAALEALGTKPVQGAYSPPGDKPAATGLAGPLLTLVPGVRKARRPYEATSQPSRPGGAEPHPADPYLPGIVLTSTTYLAVSLDLFELEDRIDDADPRASVAEGAA